MRVRPAHRSLVVLVSLLLGGTLSCGGSDSPTEPAQRRPAAMVASSEPSQTAVVGTTVTARPAVRVTAADGQPVAGVTVTFSIERGGGALVDSVTTTTAQGVATVGGWTLGVTAGENVVTASLAGLEPVSFVALGTPGAPAALAVNSGDRQTASVGAPLPVPVEVVVRDAQGNANAGTTVDWTVRQGGGTLASARSTTDTAGVARTTWTLGLEEGEQRVVASVQGAEPLAIVATAVADTASPQLTGLTLAPRTVNVDGGPDTVLFHYEVSDAGSGVLLVSASYDIPGNPFGSVCSAHRLAPGASPSLPWRCAAEVPQYAAAGVRTIQQVQVRDRVGNTRVYSTAELQAAGLPTTFEVISASPDVTPPTLAALSFSPTTVDVTSASQTIRATVALRDDRSGVFSPGLALRPPGAPGDQGQLADCHQMPRTGGTELDGTWACDLTIPRGAATGPWEVVRVSARDNAENLMYLTLDSLRAKGLPTEVTVVNATPDLTPPVLTGFTVSPSTVNLGGGEQWIEFTMTATDDIAGIVSVSATVQAPGISSAFGCGRQTPESGTPMSGTFRCQHRLDASSPDGVWTISVMLQDAVRNFRTLETAQLQAAGFPGTITVTHTP